MDILKARERDAIGKSKFMSGIAERHPQGKSGEKWLLPPETVNSSWDSHMISASEWGNAAGFDMSDMGFSRHGMTLSTKY